MSYEFLEFAFDRSVANVFILKNTIRVDRKRVRNRGNGKQPGNRAAESSIAILWLSHFVFSDDLLPFLFIVIQANAEDDQRLALELLGNLANMREGLAARRAPGGPEIDQHNLALQIVKRDSASIECGNRERRSHASASKFRTRDIAERALAIGVVVRL